MGCTHALATTLCIPALLLVVCTLASCGQSRLTLYRLLTQEFADDMGTDITSSYVSAGLWWGMQWGACKGSSIPVLSLRWQHQHPGSMHAMVGMPRRLSGINATFMQMDQSAIDALMCEMRPRQSEAWPRWCGEAQLISCRAMCGAVLRCMFETAGNQRCNAYLDMMCCQNSACDWDNACCFVTCRFFSGLLGMLVAMGRLMCRNQPRC